MCDLVKFVDDLKVAILNFKLDLCCFVFSVRAGILLCGFFNVISSMISLIAVSNGGFPPLMMSAQLSFMEGEYIASTCAFAYSSDLCLAVLLLCGMYRMFIFVRQKDIVLLRYYTYCGMAMLASTVLVYSMVIGILTVLHTLLLVISLTYQVYIILLVRSEMVELKHEEERNNYYTDYPMYAWRLKDVEAPLDNPIETYEINAPIVTKEIPEITPTKEIVVTPTSEPVKATVEPIAVDPLKDTNEPTTSKAVKENTKPETPKGTTALRYPYKFVAIKIPKEDTIKEEKENEEKQIDKDETKAESKETTKDAKKRKRSIFGRKIKSKVEDDKKEEQKNN